MPEKWTGQLIGLMHNHGVTLQDVADEMHCTKAYVSMILNSVRKPKGGKERITNAVHKIIKDKEET